MSPESSSDGQIFFCVLTCGSEFWSFWIFLFPTIPHTHTHTNTHFWLFAISKEKGISYYTVMSQSDCQSTEWTRRETHRKVWEHQSIVEDQVEQDLRPNWPIQEQHRQDMHWMISMHGHDLIELIEINSFFLYFGINKTQDQFDNTHWSSKMQFDEWESFLKDSLHTLFFLQACLMLISKQVRDKMKT